MSEATPAPSETEPSPDFAQEPTNEPEPAPAKSKKTVSAAPEPEPTPKPEPPSSTEKAVLIRTRQLRDRYGGVSDTWVDRKIANDPAFPRPYYIASRRFFKVSELENFERNLARSPSV